MQPSRHLIESPLNMDYYSRINMQIKVNNQPLDITSPYNLQQLLEHIKQGEQGVALAVNKKIISRSKWATEALKEGDEITLIKATAGG